MEIHLRITGVRPFITAYKKLVYTLAVLLGYALLGLAVRSVLITFHIPLVPVFSHPIVGVLDTLWLLGLLGVSGRLMLWNPATELSLAID